MKSLHIGNRKQPDRISTRLGDHFSGRILELEVKILRPLDPLLPLQIADIAVIDFSAAPADGSPIEKPGCGKRVIHGGAWSFPAQEIRSANRWRDFPIRSSDDTGFRIARDLDAGTP